MDGAGVAVMLGVDWPAVELAGAFAAGAVLGAVAVIRVGRVLVDYWRPPRD